MITMILIIKNLSCFDICFCFSTA